jgi:hypothetical protein
MTLMRLTILCLVVIAGITFWVDYLKPVSDRLETMVSSEVRAKRLDCKLRKMTTYYPAEGNPECEPKPTKIED